MFKDEIDKAIAAHGQWKQKLRVAIETGRSESSPTQVKLDSNCGFGKWMHERIEPRYRQSSNYQRVRSLHAEFHKEAGSILELALAGRKDDANERMKLGSQFSKLSSQLTQELKDWQKAA